MKYKIQRMIGGEWVDWCGPVFETLDQASDWIFGTVDRAEADDSGKDINVWRPVGVQ